MFLKILYKSLLLFQYIANHQKKYICRYYGYEEYGEPEEIRLKDGVDINIEFNGELRDFQKPIVEAYLKSARERAVDYWKSILVPARQLWV